MKSITAFTIIAITLFISCTSNKTDQQKAPAETVKKLVPIDSLEGSGMKQSKNFHLTGGPVTLVYAYKSQLETSGALTAYIMDEGKELAKDGGFPVLSLSSPFEKSSTAVTKAAGEYYLSVNAVGNYNVVVYEWK